MIYDIYKNHERIGSIDARQYKEQLLHGRVQHTFVLAAARQKEPETVAIFYNIQVVPWDSSYSFLNNPDNPNKDKY